jgi:hypothetical protein
MTPPAVISPHPAVTCSSTTCARPRTVEEPGFIDRDGVVDRLRPEELTHIGEKRILIGECDLDHAIEVNRRPALHELFTPIHIAALVDQGTWRQTQKQRNVVVFIIILKFGHAKPIHVSSESQRPCTSLLSFVESDLNASPCSRAGRYGDAPAFGTSCIYVTLPKRSSSFSTCSTIDD